MRIAAVSDIHGNFAALRAVLADIGPSSPDLIVNLGDCLSGPLQPAETCDFLIETDWLTIRGNHDRQVLDRPLERMGPSDRQTVPHLHEAHRAWLRALPARHRIDEVLFCHATPSDDLTYLLETIDGPRVRLACEAEIEARLAGADAPVVLCGHTHVARVIRTRAGQLVINPGSVGLQAYADDQPHDHRVENGSPHARWALVEKRNGAWHAQLRAVAYDWDGEAARAERNGRAEWAHALRTGYMPTR
jgi:putative phosphoesterase